MNISGKLSSAQFRNIVLDSWRLGQDGAGFARGGSGQGDQAQAAGGTAGERGSRRIGGLTG